MVLTAQERLTEARIALHKLMTGTQAVSLTDQNGERVEYRPANRSALARYVADLEAEVAGARTPPRRILLRTSKGT
ncbi:gpW family head-tail joining protein [Halovulum sp. GXIMD14793]